MSTGSKRATIYLDPALHKALKLKAVEKDLGSIPGDDLNR